jgi:antirestriction protein ArdC
MNTNSHKSLDDLLATLAEQLGESGQNLIPMLGVMSRFSKYSLSNQLLIFLQRPNATRVQGFQGWTKAGYVVRKGEKGIAIYAPMRFRHDDAAESTASDDEQSRLGFRVAHVFDVSQVQPLSGALAIDTTAPIDTHPPAPLACLESLKAFLSTEGIALVYAALAPGHYGQTDGQTITCAQGLAPHIEFATLVHETTHTLLHFSGERPNLTTRETEAEAVTYLLCEQLQLADTQLSIDYIRAYRGTQDTLRDSLERIRTTAQRLAAVVIPGAA